MTDYRLNGDIITGNLIETDEENAPISGNIKNPFGNVERTYAGERQSESKIRETEIVQIQ